MNHELPPPLPSTMGHFSASARRIMAANAIIQFPRPVPSICRAGVQSPPPLAAESSAELRRCKLCITSHARRRSRPAAARPLPLINRRLSAIGMYPKSPRMQFFVVFLLLLLPQRHHRLDVHKMHGCAPSDTGAKRGTYWPHPPPNTSIRWNR